MAWTIPGKNTAQNNIMSILYQEQLNVLLAGINGIDCVLSGGAVTAQGSPDMTVAVAKAAVLSNGVLKATAAGNATISTANGTNPRLDFVVINSSGAIAVRAGTAAANPVPPARSANDVVIAMVYVPANDTTIGSDQIVDMRVMRSQGIMIGKNTSVVTFNTTAAIQTYATITLPSGLFLTGKILRFKLGGNYLANSGTPTWTLTIAYGGTTMFADVTGVTTADADRGAWYVEGEIYAVAGNDQRLSGNVAFQTPGAKTAPTTGSAGDLAVTTTVSSPFYGTAAVDSDAADRALIISWTMNVSNVADETVCSFSTFELL